jgi:adenosine deaminase
MVKLKTFSILAVLAILFSFTVDPTQDSITKKIKLYDEVKLSLADSNITKNLEVSREDLSKDLGTPLTTLESNYLNDKHKSIIEKAKVLATRNSRINFNTMRSNKDLIESFCQKVPKGANLHVHPNGAISSATVKRLLKMKDMSFSSFQNSRFEFSGRKNYSSMNDNEKRIAENSFCLQADTVQFSEFASIFPLTKSLVDGGTFSELSYEAYKAYLNEAKAQGIMYVEFIKGFPTDKESIEKLNKMADKLEKETGVIPRFQLSFYRGNVTKRHAKKIIADLNANKTTAIVGVNIVADETHLPALENAQGFYTTLYDAKKNGNLGTDTFGLTIHSGELGHEHNVRDSLLIGAERIGHGVNLKDDKLTLEYARLNRVPIEINLESNRRLSVVNNIKDHPFLDYHRLGLPVSLSTDDDGILNTSPNKECTIAITNSDIQYSELKDMYLNSIRTSFLEENKKQELLKIINVRFKEFEKSWSE